MVPATNWHSADVAAWEQRGRYRNLLGRRVFTLDIPATRDEHEPLLVLHGFPTCSFDFHRVVDSLSGTRRLLLLDMLGYGLSEKPDMPYTIELQADVVQAFVAELGVTRLALLTHDMGDTVGGELLARNADGQWPADVAARVVTNGSIYIEMAQLSAGQQFLLSLPDERLDASFELGSSNLEAALADTFSPHSSVDRSALAGAAELVSHESGQLLLPRIIRYIEQRRRNQDRYTGAIETHPSPLCVVWGPDDPIAVAAMATRLHEARSDSRLVWLTNVGHYPMLEAPDAFARAVEAGLRGS